MKTTVIVVLAALMGTATAASAEAGDSDPEVSSDTLGEVYPPDVREMIYEFGVQLRDEAGYTDLDPNDPEAVIAARKDYYSNEEPVVIPDDSADGEELPGEITETSRSETTVAPVEPAPSPVPKKAKAKTRIQDFGEKIKGTISQFGDGGTAGLGASPKGGIINIPPPRVVSRSAEQEERAFRFKIRKMENDYRTKKLEQFGMKVLN